jgi:hypothetical protein
MGLRIGVDFGGVLSVLDDGNGKGQQQWNTKIDIPGALKTLNQWKAAGHQLFLISFCGAARARLTANSIRNQCPNLFDDVMFVRMPSYKWLALWHYGCHVMIDDSEKDVLEHVGIHTPTVARYLFKNVPNEWTTALPEFIHQITTEKFSTIKPKPLPTDLLKQICYIVSESKHNTTHKDEKANKILNVYVNDSIAVETKKVEKKKVNNSIIVEAKKTSRHYDEYWVRKGHRQIQVSIDEYDTFDWNNFNRFYKNALSKIIKSKSK